MNRSRVIILAVAAVAAIVAALLVRSLMGGGTEKTQAAIAPVAPHIEMTQVLVASNAIEAGTALTQQMVRWQSWPTGSVDSTFITQNNVPSLDKLLDGTVVRVPVVAGEPLTSAKMVRADGGGYMAAMLTPGMRAVSINITTESGAGGFILPNDRVDVILTKQIGDQGRLFNSKTILKNIRVLAIDQTFTQDKDQKTVTGAKSATLELTPGQGELVERAQAGGTISLSLRALGDSSKTIAEETDGEHDGGDVAVIRYGVAAAGSHGKGE